LMMKSNRRILNRKQKELKEIYFESPRKTGGMSNMYCKIRRTA